MFLLQPIHGDAHFGSVLNTSQGILFDWVAPDFGVYGLEYASL